MLSKEKFNQITEYINHYGREIEKAYLNYHFFNGNKADVINALSTFQNEDGGFGHGLEADSWNPNSSPLTTSVALAMLYSIQADKNTPIIQNAIKFLGNYYFDSNTATWQTIISSNNDYPHAPWWTYVEGGRNTWSFNPSIELAALMFHFASPEDQAYKNADLSILKAKEYLNNPNNQLPDHFHEILNYLVAADILQDQQLLDGILPYIESTICKDFSLSLTQYVANPLTYLRFDYTKNTMHYLLPYYKMMKENAEVLIEVLPDNDAWGITWTWGGNYPETFVKAESIWKAISATKKLLQFKKLNLLPQ